MFAAYKLGEFSLLALKSRKARGKHIMMRCSEHLKNTNSTEQGIHAFGAMPKAGFHYVSFL